MLLVAACCIHFSNDNTYPYIIMGLLDSVKNAATKTKMRGELSMIDREITKTKYKHGVLIYDVLGQRHHSTATSDNDQLPLEGLEAAFMASMEDMQDIFVKRSEKDDKIDALEAKGESRVGGTTAGERAKNAGRSMLDAGASTKLKTEMAFYDREMRVRKEIFGIQVFQELDLLSKEDFQETDNGVGEALNRAKKDVAAVMQRKRQKELDIESLK
jgi:hypothetical protein